MEKKHSGGHLGGQYRPLDPEQIERIHQAALYILENIGFTYEQGLDNTLAMLEDAGAKIDQAHSRIYFPPDLILSQISKTPERVILCSRDAQNDIDLWGDRVYMGTGGMAVTVVDIETGQARKSCLQDIYNIGRIVDRLDNIHFYLRPCTAHDVPTSVYDVNCMYTAMQATTKHYMTGAIDRQSFRDMLALASIVAGDEKKLAETYDEQAETELRNGLFKINREYNKLINDFEKNQEQSSCNKGNRTCFSCTSLYIAPCKAYPVRYPLVQSLSRSKT